MMYIETENFVIKSNKLIPYIEEVMEYLNNQIPTILEFFKQEKLSSKKEIIIWTDINEYRKHIEQFTEYKDWMCADTFDGNINMLSIEECHKTKAHEFTDVNHFKTTIAHEFVHICHQQVQQAKEDNNDAWYWEALATNLGNPEQFSVCTINITSNELLNSFNDIEYAYGIAYTIGNYMLSTYDQETLLNYVKNPKQLIEDTPRLIEETKQYINNKKQI